MRCKIGAGSLYSGGGVRDITVQCLRCKYMRCKIGADSLQSGGGPWRGAKISQGAGHLGILDP